MDTPIIPDGYKVIVNDTMCWVHVFVQVRFPVTKKKRIRKKWTKNTRRNFGVRKVQRAYMIHTTRTILVSQKLYDKLKKLPAA